MIPHILTNLTGWILFAMLFLAAGSFIDKLIRVNLHSKQQRFVLRIALGMVAWIYLIFLMAAAQVLYNSVLFTTMALILGIWLFTERKRILAFLKDSSWKTFRWTPTLVVLFFTLGTLFVFYFMIAMLPRVCADAHNYHLYVPSRVIANHGFYSIPFKPISSWPLNMEMLFMGALMVRDYNLAHLMHFSAGLIILAVLYLYSKENQGRFAGMLAVLFFLSNDIVVWIFPTCYADLGIAMFFLLSFWFICKAIDDPDQEKRYLLLAGIFAGAMAGSKLNAFVGGIILGLLFLGNRVVQKKFWNGLKHLLIYFGLPAVLLLSPWLIKSFILNGNPVYPFLYQIFGGPDWSQELSQDLVRSHLKMGMGREPIDYLLLPFRVIWMSKWNYTHFYGVITKEWIVLVPISILFGLKKPLVRRSLFVAVLYLYSWGMGTQQMRHIIPVVIMISLASAVTVSHLVSKIKKEWIVNLLRSTLILASCALVFSMVIQSQHAYNSTKLGQRFLHSNTLNSRLQKFIQKKLPEKARILAPNSVPPYVIGREVICENLLGVKQIKKILLSGKTKSEIRRAILESGFDYILINKRKERKFPKMFKKMLKDPKYVEHIFRGPSYDLYKINHVTKQNAETKEAKAY